MHPLHHPAMNKKIISVILFLLISSSLLLASCRSKDARTTAQAEPVTLVFYGLYDNEDVYSPLIESYQSQHKNVTVVYKKFTDPDTYLDLIINELAEGEGPDIFLMHNSWFPKHYKKLTSAPSEIVTPDIFRSLFVEVAGKDLIIPDSSNVEQVWGLPLYVDSVALYYNDDQIEDALPTQGSPSTTWDGIKNDVVALNRADQSFERFERAGIAMGRSDNLLRAFDVLMTIFYQYKVQFYSADLKEVILDKDPNALAALQLYTSFGLPSQKNYSWNKFLSDSSSSEKEITTFAKGKVSMIFGYSYTYEDIINEINRLKSQGIETIDINSVKVQEIPQVYDPELSSETRSAYASYFVPVVSRTSANSAEAWSFLASLTTQDNLRYFHDTTHRPSALRSLIAEQMSESIYGIFAAQVGYAASLPMPDPERFQAIFLDGIDQILATAKADTVLKSLAGSVKSLIPSNGIKPIYIQTE